MAQSVAVAVGGIGDKLVNSLAKKVEALKVGPGMDKQSEMGPLVTKEHLAKVKSYVDIGIKEGAKLIVDGRDFKLQGYEKGYFRFGGSATMTLFEPGRVKLSDDLLHYSAQSIELYAKMGDVMGQAL